MGIYPFIRILVVLMCMRKFIFLF